jgi:hypothetical protein
MNSPFLTLNARDFVKGLFIAILTAVVTMIYTSIEANNLVLDWKSIGMAALSASIAYIMKNLLTNSNDQIMKPEATKTEDENQ